MDAKRPAARSTAGLGRLSAVGSIVFRQRFYDARDDVSIDKAFLALGGLAKSSCAKAIELTQCAL